MNKINRRRGEGYSSLSDEYASPIEVSEKEEPKKDMVKVTITNLNIRKGPGKDFERTGDFTGAGEFELTERQNGYGKLASGEGWISLDFCEDI